MRITKPTLLVDKTKSQDNIRRMVRKANDSNIVLRPHFKTHQCAEIGNWFRVEGIDACTVSSVSMATYFVDHGWNDITIAFPFNPLEAETISILAIRASVNLLIESEESLKKANEQIEGKVGYFLKIDIGTHRTGIDPDNVDLVGKLVSKSNNRVGFKGFLAHAGHTYHCGSHKEIATIYSSSVKKLMKLKETFGGLASYGDTPSCSTLLDFSALDEIRPGNFVFYDWMQHRIGSCELGHIAVCMACPVVAIHRDRHEMVVYGGGAHLSKDWVMEDEKACYGKAVALTGTGWASSIIGNVKSLSQEHGVIEMHRKELHHWKVGDLIGIIPVHSCMSVDLSGHLMLTSGQRIEKLNKE